MESDRARMRFKSIFGTDMLDCLEMAFSIPNTMVLPSDICDWVSISSANSSGSMGIDANGRVPSLTGICRLATCIDDCTSVLPVFSFDKRLLLTISLNWAVTTTLYWTCRSRPLLSIVGGVVLGIRSCSHSVCVKFDGSVILISHFIVLTGSSGDTYVLGFLHRWPS